MNYKPSVILSAFMVAALLLCAGFAFAQAAQPSAPPVSPFIGNWQATDVDGSKIRLTIAGIPVGPFQITWTESSFSFCDGQAGIILGTGMLTEDDPNILEADLRLECFTTGASRGFHFMWRFHPATNTLSSRDENGVVTIWFRPGRPLPPPPPLNLRVNYGHDWVESFYEGGHMAWITVTDGDGNLKATAELVTEPKDYWGGETGFQSLDSVWFDGDGNPMEYPPDIQPNDWVYGWVDNGASAQVKIGDISGMIDLEADSIQGTIMASWITDPVQVECLDWGSGGEPFDSEDGGTIWTDGIASYSCSWEEWDIQPGQTIGVGYFGPDGHWVANAFFVPMPTFVAYLPSTIVGYGWKLGNTITIHINENEYTAQSTVEEAPGDPTQSLVLFELWRDDFFMEAGDHIVMIDEAVSITKELWVTNLAVTDINLGERTVSGIYDPAYDLWVWLYDLEGQVPETDPDKGTWIATFAQLPPGAWGGATQWDTDGDGTSLDFQVPMIFIVTSTDDVIENDGVCTLREAVIAANTNSPSGEASGECPAGLEFATDTILLAPDAIYSLIIDSTNEDGALDGDLDIWDNSAAIDLIIMVEENGRATISQDASVDDRVMDVMATVEIEGLTLTGGSNVDLGGGVHNAGGTLIIRTCTVSDNTANHGGGIFNDAFGTLILAGSTVSGNTANLNGGGVWNFSTLTVDASTISANSATYNGGGLFNYEGTTTIQNESIIGGDPSAEEGNVANLGGGMTVWSGSVTIDASTVSGNSVSWDGGGVWIMNEGTLMVNASTISANSAANDGGGLHNHGSLAVDASQVSDNTATYGGGGFGNDGGSLTLTNSTISANSSGYGGGAANWPNSTLTIDASTFTGNMAEDGGGVNNHGTVTIRNGSEITGNTAGWIGGGISNLSGGKLQVEEASTISGNSSEGFAGGLYNDSASTLTVNNSTITSNVSVYGGGGIMNEGSLTVENSVLSANSSGQGGALYNTGATIILNSVVGGGVGEGNIASDGGGGLFNLGTMTVDGSTVSYNWAPIGGGLFNWTGGMLTLSNSTVSINSAYLGGGLHNKEDSTTVIQNGTVFSLNYAESSGGGIHNWGTLTITGSVLSDNTSLIGVGSAINSDVNLENAMSITGSCIVGNGGIAVFNSQLVLQIATYNWWGDPSGPSGAGLGSGDSISPYIDFSGWLTEQPAICAP